MTAGSINSLGFAHSGRRELTMAEVWERYHKAYTNWRAAKRRIESLTRQNAALTKRLKEAGRINTRLCHNIVAAKSFIADAVSRLET